MKYRDDILHMASRLSVNIIVRKLQILDTNTKFEKMIVFYLIVFYILTHLLLFLIAELSCFAFMSFTSYNWDMFEHNFFWNPRIKIV